MNTNETNEQTEWRPLEPGELIQEGDEILRHGTGPWEPAETCLGLAWGDYIHEGRTRRPRPATPNDAPTPDEHKCGFLCNHCKQHFPGYAQYWGHKCKPTTSKADENERDLEVLSAMRERDEARAELAKVKAGPDNELRKTVLLRDYSEIIDHLQLCQDKEDELFGDMRHNYFEQAITAIQDLDALVIDLTTYRPPPPTEGSAVDAVDKLKAKGIEWVPIGRLEDLARRLERERDEARAELAKVKAKALPESACFFLKAILDASHAGCLNNCLHCGEVNELAYQEARDAAIDQHYAGYNAAVESPPAEGSAVEWVGQRIYTQWDEDGTASWHVSKADALELARRCEEAERSAKRWESIADEHIKTMRALSAELVAAEKNKQYWMESASNATCAAGKAIEERNDLRAQLAAAQAEAGRLREALLAMREYYKDHMITGKLHKQVEAALAKKEGER